ncbi:hypothetical protein CRG98_007822 [Punica granatum]|uniref:Uncharacterized protein n=1 Tax=Punica granatum TaxID=22663 RepID=A0A2I0KVE1_PUNGR|nr:hypothetical protein CRG98_007822 [Punica granatum]
MPKAILSGTVQVSRFFIQPIRTSEPARELNHLMADQIVLALIVGFRIPKCTVVISIVQVWRVGGAGDRGAAGSCTACRRSSMGDLQDQKCNIF